MKTFNRIDSLSANVLFARTALNLHNLLVFSLNLILVQYVSHHGAPLRRGSTPLPLKHQLRREEAVSEDCDWIGGAGHVACQCLRMCPAANRQPPGRLTTATAEL